MQNILPASMSPKEFISVESQLPMCSVSLVSVQKIELLAANQERPYAVRISDICLKIVSKFEGGVQIPFLQIVFGIQCTFAHILGVFQDIIVHCLSTNSKRNLVGARG